MRVKAAVVTVEAGKLGDNTECINDLSQGGEFAIFERGREQKNRKDHEELRQSSRIGFRSTKTAVSVRYSIDKYR